MDIVLKTRSFVNNFFQKISTFFKKFQLFSVNRFKALKINDFLK